MAYYNVVEASYKNNDLVEGTSAADSIRSSGGNSTINALGGNDYVKVSGKNSTVNAGDGDDIVSLGEVHDVGLWSGFVSDIVVYGGAGNDSVSVYLSGAKVFGEADNDTIYIGLGKTFADGGDGNDVFDFFSGYNVTITGGTGNDTVIIRSGYNKAVITDFSVDDVFCFNNTSYSNVYSDYGTINNGRILTQHVENGNVVISDNVSIGSSGGNTFRKDIEPNLSITLQGVSDISKVANAKYYLYNNSTPMKQSTLGELFGVESTTTTSEEETQTSATTTTTKETTTTATATQAADNSVTSTTPTVINNYYGDTYNFDGNNGSVVIGSSVSGGVTNTTNIDNSKNIIISGNTYTYNGGDKVINNYQQGEVVKLASDYQGIDLKENSFFVKSSSGQLEIQNARDKFIGYSAESEVAVYSYVAGMSGAIDGRDKSQVEMMIGADNADNQIYAGSGGSSMWGGNGGNDIMTGGEGYDEFFYAMGSGNDVVQNASDNDLINLLGVSLSQISYTEVTQSEINIGFNDGGNLKLQGQAATGFALEGVVYAADRSIGGWRTK